MVSDADNAAFSAKVVEIKRLSNDIRVFSVNNARSNADILGRDPILANILELPPLVYHSLHSRGVFARFDSVHDDLTDSDLPCLTFASSLVINHVC